MAASLELDQQLGDELDGELLLLDRELDQELLVQSPESSILRCDQGKLLEEWTM